MEGRSQQVNLGCSTLILIALIVLIFSGGRNDEIRREIQSLNSTVRQLNTSVDSLTNEVKALLQKLEGTRPSLLAPKVEGHSQQARITAAKADIAALEVALEAFEIDNSRYPTTQEGLRVLLERPGDASSWRGPYLKRGIPKDPWGNEYIFESPGRQNENGYDLSSMGPDMRQGSEDDVTNWTLGEG